MAKVKVITKSKNTKLGQLILNTPTLKKMGMKKYSKLNERKFYKLPSYDLLIEQLTQSEQEYIVTGRVKVKVISSNGDVSFTTRKYQLPFKATANLNDRQLFNVVGYKLQEFYDKPHFGNSKQNVTDFSMNVLNLPDNFKFTERTKIYSSSNLELKLFNTLSEKNIEIETNCVIDYIHNELQKISKKCNINKLIEQFKNFGYSDDGVTIKMFENVMNNHYKNYGYLILGPSFNTILRKQLKYQKFCFTFYVNNKHLYPITNTIVQKYINKSSGQGRNDFYQYFQELQISRPNKILYMENINDDDFIDDRIYIMNKDKDIDDYCISLVNKYNSGIEYIDLDHKTGHIKEFKHPTKNIIICEYADHHCRKELCKKINLEYNNCFIDFKNQSYPYISKKLLEILNDIPQSFYRTDTIKYLDEHEPKPIVDNIKDCKKDDYLQIDYYKQYSTIFYVDFQKEGFLIPIYDIFNDINEYNDEEITLGEYYIEQKKYKGVKLFGCFIHYYIVKELLRKKIITKNDIKYCINTKRGFQPSCFKKFVQKTSEICDEKTFKKLNNWLNGTLKNSVSRKSKSFFTNDVESLSYIIQQCITQNKKYSWSHDNKTGFNFVKSYSEQLNNSNTSSFYRATLSCSILQTIKLILKCSKIGSIVKVLTDAVYFIPNNKVDINICPPKIENQIIPNLGRYFYDLNLSDVYKNRVNDKEFIYGEINKDPKSKYVSGGGGLGKSYKVVKECLEMKDKKIIFLSLSNNAVLELKKKIIELNKGNIPEKWNLKTFALFEVMQDSKCDFKLKYAFEKYDLVVVDEIFMTSHKYFRMLELSDVPKIYMGDRYQLPAITTEYEEKFNMHEYLCKYYKNEVKEYVKGKSRYDEKTFKIIESFKKSGRTKILKDKLNDYDENKIYDFYIVSTNKIKDSFNKKCCEYNHKKEDRLFTFTKIVKTEDKDKDNDEDESESECEDENEVKDISCYIGLNMPIICIRNHKELKKEYSIFNNWKGKITSMDKTTIEIYGCIYTDEQYKNSCLKIDISMFRQYFRPCYASTVHKYQGGKIEGNYAILETKRDYFFKDEDNEWVKGVRKLCTLNMMYTSLTRTGNYKNIYINKDWKKLENILYLDKPTSKNIIINNKRQLWYCYEHNKKNNDFKNEIKLFKNEKVDNKKNKYKLIFKRKCTYNIAKYMKNIFMYFDDEAFITNKNKIMEVYKPKINQTVNNSKIYIDNDKVRLCYYDECNKRKEKKLRVTKNRSLKQAFLEAKELNNNALVIDKNNLILSFS
jgi:hypothetical protein